MTIARLAATYGAIRRAMETYGKSRLRINGLTLTSATPVLTNIKGLLQNENFAAAPFMTIEGQLYRTEI